MIGDIDDAASFGKLFFEDRLVDQVVLQNVNLKIWDTSIQYLTSTNRTWYVISGSEVGSWGTFGLGTTLCRCKGSGSFTAAVSSITFKACVFSSCRSTSSCVA